MTNALTEPPTQTSVPTVKQKNDRHVRIARWLHYTCDLVPATSLGTALDREVPKDAIGLLLPHPPDERPWPRNLIFPVQCWERPFVGVLWLSHLEKGAVGDHWLLEVYGKEHLRNMMSLMRELAVEFDSRVDLRLVDEHARREVVPRGILY